MIQIKRGLWGAVLVTLLLHIGYSIIDQQRPYGAFFSSGISQFDNGQIVNEHSRFQFQKDRVYDYQQDEDWSRFFSFKIKSSVMGSMELTSVSALLTPIRPVTQHDDNELKFYEAYYAKEDTLLTLYRLRVVGDNFCVYVRELHKLRCLGLTP